MIKRTIVWIIKIQVITAIAYAMLVGAIYFIPGPMRSWLHVGDMIANAIKQTHVASDGVMILVDMMLDGKAFMVIPFLLIAGLLTEALLFALGRMSKINVASGVITLAAIVGGVYLLTN